ncbi:MAG: hypothetical protein HYV07_16195 [Deltaproteobacteria bacterium]|nr:hypothetical protein [Deltaproteobacteria bacterium]
MTGKRDRVPRPQSTTGWVLRFQSKDAADGWEELSRQLSNATGVAYDHISQEPRSHARPDRQHRLKGDYGSRVFDGRSLEQWQYEVSGAARVWYVIDDDKKTVWITDASVGHPKKTE